MPEPTPPHSLRRHQAIRPIPEDPHPRSLRGHQAITLSLLFLAGIVNFLDRSSLSIANTTVRQEMHLSATQMGWLLSAFSFAYGFAQLPLIGLLDRVGTRWVLGVGLTLWSAAQMLTGLVRTLPIFLTLRVLLGIGEAPFYPSGIRSTREWFSQSTRGRATAVMSSSQTIGLSFAPPVLTALMLALGWRAMFVVLGASGLLVAALWIVLHRARQDTPYAEATEEATNPSPSHQERTVIPAEGAAEAEGPAFRPQSPLSHAKQNAPHEPAWRVLLRQPAVWGMMFGWGGVNYTVWLYLAWLPAYLEEQRHLPLATSGWVAALPYLAGACGMLSSGFVSDALAARGQQLTTIHRRNLVLGMIASAAGTFFVAHSATTAQAVAGTSAALFFIHFAGTSGWGYVQAISPLRYVASLGALQNFFSFMIASIAPVLTGWLLDRTHSFTLALGLCSAITLLGALSYATLASPKGMHLDPA
ncbi:MAG: MFS transporter [Edaphobacter sp.]|uniref:MFS transporter n=1 Tax=Edaphobacter sp. TaxID=1934404 RepID=UPI002382EB7D|nr:MFS transporter [Edaphobacter sp.]MDE1178816.1 MFS transporter [Edaphobacter sp.]